MEHNQSFNPNLYQGRQQDQDDYGRANYIPDNDDNRDYGHRNYQESMHGNMSNQGAWSSDRGYQQDQEPDRYGNTSYGKQYYEERDRMRQQAQYRGGNQYGNDYGRRDYGRSMLGHSYGSGGTGYQHQGYGSSADGYRSDYQGDNQFTNRQRSDYSGDEDRSWWDRTRDKVSSWLDNDSDRDRNRDYRQGQHYGKGPKGYERSQDRIREDVCERLSADHRLDATEIAVEVSGKDVILTGLVHSKADKRRAEDVAESVYGVGNVENRIKVHHDRAGADSWGSSIGL